jgi:hypothetical protein
MYSHVIRPERTCPIEQIKEEFKENAHIFERFMKIKKFSFLQGLFDKGKMSDTKVRSFAKMIMSTL